MLSEGLKKALGFCYFIANTFSMIYVGFYIMYMLFTFFNIVDEEDWRENFNQANKIGEVFVYHYSHQLAILYLGLMLNEECKNVEMNVKFAIFVILSLVGIVKISLMRKGVENGNKV